MMARSALGSPMAQGKHRSESVGHDRDRLAYLAARARAGLPAKIADEEAWHQVAASLTTGPARLPSARAA